MSPKMRSVWKWIGRVLLVFFSTVVVLAAALLAAVWILVKGPSPTIRRLFVNTVKETSAGGFLADIFLTEQEVQALRNEEQTIDEVTIDYSGISLPTRPDPITGTTQTLDPGTSSAVTSQGEATTEPVVVPPEDDGLELIDISGPTYNGKLLIVKDPTRVFVGIPDAYGSHAKGLTVEEMIDKYGAVAGINAGGFYDPNGQGTGGIPDGVVIFEGKLVWGDMDKKYNFAGISDTGILYASKMTPREALKLGVRYACSFGPTLVANGKIVTTNDSSLNPRTAIGQRADGAILLLVINGRSVSALGATYLDLASIMVDYGAINATNLDGGSSSIMIYKGEYVTNSAYVFGIRTVPTAFLVR